MQGARNVLNLSCCCDRGFPALLRLLPLLDCHSEFLCWVMLCWASLLLGSLQISQFSFPIKIGKLQFSGTAALIEIALALLVRAVRWRRKGRNSCSTEELAGDRHKKGREGQGGFTSGEAPKRSGGDVHQHRLFPCVPISYFSELGNLVQIRAKAESSPLVPSCSLTCSWTSLNIITRNQHLEYLTKQAKPEQS